MAKGHLIRPLVLALLSFPDCNNFVGKLHRIKGFFHNSERTLIHHLFREFFFCFRGHKYYRDRFNARIVSKSFPHLVARHAWHHDVEQKQIRRKPRDRLNGSGTISELQQFETTNDFERQFHNVPNAFIIFYMKDTF